MEYAERIEKRYGDRFRAVEELVLAANPDINSVTKGYARTSIAQWFVGVMTAEEFVRSWGVDKQALSDATNGRPS